MCCAPATLACGSCTPHQTTHDAQVVEGHAQRDGIAKPVGRAGHGSGQGRLAHPAHAPQHDDFRAVALA
jgi:hypothetical protein